MQVYMINVNCKVEYAQVNICSSFDELHKCTVAKLEKCKENTPANIVDAVFKFTRKVSPCRDYKVRTGAATGLEEKDSGTTLKTSLFLPLLLPLIAGRYL